MNRIISMATYSYNKWIPSFYYSIRAHNKHTPITIYLINYPQEKANFLRGKFQDVEFIERTGQFPLKETFNINKDAYLVTYLKGEFIKHNTKLHKQNVLWMDITSLIRTNLDDVFKLISEKDVVLIQRDPNITTGNRAFAAEIFGVNHTAQSCIDYYARSCESLKQYWYADQISLCNFPTQNKGYLEFQVFCNFYYSQEARTWSDRGKKGQGKIEADDADYTLDMYQKDLTKHYANYNSLNKGFFNDFNSNAKPKILVFLDDDKWCYYTTAMEVVKRLSDEFEFTVIRNLELDKHLVRKWEGDLIWARCGAHRAVKILLLKPEYQKKIITTITTGGTNAVPVVKRHMLEGKYQPAVFTQNKITSDLLKEHGYQGKVYFIPNGVDEERFKPINKTTDNFIVGFAGRHGDAASDKIKGYTEFFKIPCQELHLTHVLADSQYHNIPHAEMHKFFQSINVLIQASANEGCSNTIMEAMACGVPCIITRVGYHGEYCEDGKNVVFVDRDKEQIKAALIKLRDDKDYYNTISKGAREFALNHKWDTQAQKVRLAFRKLIK